MYCSYCGQQNDDGAKFCTKCGKDLLGESLNPEFEQDYQARKQQEAQPQHGKAVAICALIFGILGGLLGFIFSIIGIAGYYKKGTSEYKMCMAGLILAIVNVALSFIMSFTGFYDRLYTELGLYIAKSILL